MRLSPVLLCLATFVIPCWPEEVFAQENSYASEIAAARLELKWAKLEFRDYWQIEYARLRRHLDAQVRLTEEEVRLLKERLRMYRPFDRFSTGSAVQWSVQNLRMCLLDAELRLQDLWAERSNLIRLRTPEWRILEARVQDARFRVAELERAAENARHAAAVR